MAKGRADKTICTTCGNKGEFYGRQAQCKKCTVKRTSARSKLWRATPEGRAENNARACRRRRNPARRCTIVLKDSRYSDRKYGRQNDLTREFVDPLLKEPCSYCGETGLMMTLDRKDNAIGHTQSNVAAACERCNYVRRDMPYGAWLVVAAAMRSARAAGLFGTWSCSIHRRHGSIQGNGAQPASKPGGP